MKARKYHVFGLGAVTAYDAEDVEPLVEAAAYLRQNAQHIFDKHPVRDWGETLAAIDAALKPFTQQDGGEQ